MDFIYLLLEKSKNLAEVDFVQSDQRTVVLHIDEGIGPCTWVCHAKYVISARLPKRVGTCFENCCVDGAKLGKEQQHGQVGCGAPSKVLVWEKNMLNVKTATWKADCTPPLESKTFLTFFV